VQPSSLVFIAIVALWLLALVPAWVRRRHHLVSGPVGDRFSTRTRVLESRPQRRGARTAHADHQGQGPTGERAPAEERGSAGEEASAAMEVSATEMPVRRASSASPRRSTAQVAARRRSAVLLVLVLATLVSWVVVVAAASGVAPSLIGGVGMGAAVPATVLLALYVLALRSAARRRGSARRATRRPSSSHSGNQTPTRDHARVADQAGSLSGARQKSKVRRKGQRQAPARPVVRQNPQRQFVTQRIDLDLESLTAPDVVAEAPVTDESWTPVPVPPPTYTMKPVVTRGAPSPLDLAHRLDLAEGASGSGARVIFSSGPARLSPSVEASPESADVHPRVGGPVRVDGGSTGGGSAGQGSAGRLGEQPDASQPEEELVMIDLDEVLARRRAVNG
jgi:hypothetical protein